MLSRNYWSWNIHFIRLFWVVLQKTVEKHKRLSKSIKQPFIVRLGIWRMSNISNEVQSAFDMHDLKTMYNILLQVFGPAVLLLLFLWNHMTVELLSKILKVCILKRWTEHFTNLFFNPSGQNISPICSLNPSAVDDTVNNNFPQSELLHEMCVRPTLDEVKKSIKQVNTGKAAGLDGISCEALTVCGRQCGVSNLR